MRKINPELWLLLFLVLIAAMLNFLVASQRMALVFYFLPTLYSAYHFGRRHATLTAVASIVLVVLLVFANPGMFRRHILRALEESNWNVSGAARALGMERTNLHKRIRALGLSRGR